MPFLKKIKIPDGTIGIWKLSENSSELLPGVKLTKPEQSFFNTVKNEKRKKEYLAVRTLLKKLAGADFKITYEKNGRPQLLNYPVNISISHSSDLAVIFLSEKNIGIDVENIHRKIAPLSKRFLLQNEMEHIEKLANKQLTQIIYWSAKEAIFKCTPEQNIHFNRQINIKPFVLKEEGNFNGELTTGNHAIYSFELGYFLLENNVVVSCVEL